MAISFMSISQDLKPLIIVQNKVDTLYGFTIPQSKYIAKKISNSIHCDSLVVELSTRIRSFEYLDGVCDEKVRLFQQKEQNYKFLLVNKDKEIAGLGSDIVIYKDKIKKQKIVFVVVGLILSAIIVGK